MKKNVEFLKGSKSDEYYTPERYWRPLGPFVLDPCAGPVSRIAETNYRIQDGQDGLELPWNGFVWLNPPYSDKARWIERMKAHGHGIMMMPASTATEWFMDLVRHCISAYFIKGKVHFINSTSRNYGGSVYFPFGREASARLKHLRESREIPGTYWVESFSVPKPCEPGQTSLFLTNQNQEHGKKRI